MVITPGHGRAYTVQEDRGNSQRRQEELEFLPGSLAAGRITAKGIGRTCSIPSPGQKVPKVYKPKARPKPDQSAIRATPGIPYDPSLPPGDLAHLNGDPTKPNTGAGRGKYLMLMDQDAESGAVLVGELLPVAGGRAVGEGEWP